jgi:DNA repair protein RadC
MWTGETRDRPRERLMRHGPGGVNDVELLAAVLRNGRSGQNAVELARTLLGIHRDVRALARVRPDVLAGYAGMGPAKAAAVAAAFELGRRVTELGEAVPVRRAEDVVAVARREAGGMRRDELLLFVTDIASRVRWTVCVATGVVASATAPVRRVVEAVRAHGGAGFALARLSTAASASALPVDAELVRRLRVAAEYAGLRFLDYVVVADLDWCGVVTPGPVAPELLALPPPDTPGQPYSPDPPYPVDVSARSRPPPGP